MRIHLVQPNLHIGNYEAIFQVCVAEIESAIANKADIVIFPEMAATGYPALDLLTYPSFNQKAFQLINDLAPYSKELAIVIGGPQANTESIGKTLFNAAYFLDKGSIQKVVHKMLLPTYDIFDEYRYFHPGKPDNLIHFKGHKICLTICEDIWNEDTRNLYGDGPLDYLLKQGVQPDLHINIAASPYSPEQQNRRNEVLLKNAQKGKCPVVYSNHAGTQTELVFDGNSQIVYPDGKRYQLPLFTACSATIELGETQEQAIPASPLEQKHQALVAGVKDFFEKSGFSKAILGLSGGIDSALTAAIAAEALGKDNVLGVLMPSQYSSDHSIQDALDLAKNLGMKTETVAIKDSFGAVRSAMPADFQATEFGLAEENFQARLRGLTLMGMSNKFGHVLLNTSNKSEIAVGYGTLYGDMCGGLAVIGDLYKTEVFDLCKWLNRNEEVIPWNTITKPPSAELRPDQKDSDSLPDYAVLDAILKSYIEEQKGPEEIIALGFDAETVNKSIALVNRNEFKRFQSAPILRVSKKAFGFGRRIPLVSKPLNAN